LESEGLLNFWLLTYKCVSLITYYSFSKTLDTPEGNVLVDYSKNIITEETLPLLFNLVSLSPKYLQHLPKSIKTAALCFVQKL